MFLIMLQSASQETLILTRQLQQLRNTLEVGSQVHTSMYHNFQLNLLLLHR